MPVFWFLVILGLIGLWFLLAFSYKGIGRFFKRLFKDSVDAIVKDDLKDFDITYSYDEDEDEDEDEDGGNE